MRQPKVKRKRYIAFLFLAAGAPAALQRFGEERAIRGWWSVPFPPSRFKFQFGALKRVSVCWIAPGTRQSSQVAGWASLINLANPARPCGGASFGLDFLDVCAVPRLAWSSQPQVTTGTHNHRPTVRPTDTAQNKSPRSIHSHSLASSPLASLAASRDRDTCNLLVLSSSPPSSML